MLHSLCFCDVPDREALISLFFFLFFGWHGPNLGLRIQDIRATSTFGDKLSTADVTMRPHIMALV